MIKKYLVLPLGKEGNTLKVLVHDPMDINLIDDLQFRLGGKVELALSAKNKISEYIDNVMSDVKNSIDKLTMDMSVDTSLDMSLDSTMDKSIDIDADGNDADKAQQGPIIKLVQPDHRRGGQRPGVGHPHRAF